MGWMALALTLVCLTISGVVALVWLAHKNGQREKWHRKKAATKKAEECGL